MLGIGTDVLALQEARTVDELRLKVALQHEVVLERIVQHEAVLMTILRDVAHAEDGTLADLHIRDILTAQRDRALFHRFEAGQAVDELRLAVSVDAGDTDDLALAHVERDLLEGVVVVELRSNREALDLQDGLAGLGRLLVDGKFHIAADHHAGKLFLRRVLDVHGADVLALAQDSAAVRHGHDLVELVGDEEDGLAFLCQAAHDVHELFDLLRRQNGSRLIEDQDLIVAVEHLEDLRALLHADGDVLDESIGVDVQAILLRELHDLFPGLILLQEARLVRLHAEDDVFKHRKALHELKVLMHHANAQCIGIVRIIDLDFHAILLDNALFRLIQAEQDAHQRGLACAVFAEERMDLAMAKLERDVVVCNDTGEPLGDIQHFDCILFVTQTDCLPLLWFQILL